MTKCDSCDKPAKWLAFAVYDVDDGAVHPILARYPAPMIRACNEHFIGKMWWDLKQGGTTGQFVVRPAT